MIGGRSRNRASGRWQGKGTVVGEKSSYGGMKADMRSSFNTANQTVVAPFFLTTTLHCDKTLTWFMASQFFTDKDKNHTFTSRLIWLLSCFTCHQFVLDLFSPVTVALYHSRVPSHLRSSNIPLTQPEISFISFWGGTYSNFTFSFYRFFKKILL